MRPSTAGRETSFPDTFSKAVLTSSAVSVPYFWLCARVSASRLTIPTCQLDFALPERFDLNFIGEDNKEHRPVVIHRAILGSSDRFISFLIEETKGFFPVWLAPVQVKILPITDNQIEYAKEIETELRRHKFRVELDESNEKIGYKIRKAQLEKVPYMLVLGAKEQEENIVAVRSRKDGDIGNMKVDEFVAKVQKEIDNKVIG